MKYMHMHLVIVCVTAAVAQMATAQFNGDCYQNGMEPIRCVPIAQSFSLGQEPVVNSTCGTPPSEYCLRRVTFRGTESTCGLICNASDPANAHPPTLMTDFLLTEESWWQTEPNVETVRIQLSLRTLVEITVISFDFVSFKPSAFYLEKSIDYGTTFQPFHYFASSCLDTYMIDPDVDLEYENETNILCQEIDTPDPGQISFFPSLGRPSANDSTPGFSEELYEYITATDIRVTLEGHFALTNLPSDDVGDYYYAIEDLNVVGGCQCHGHASSCIIDPSNGEYRCECEHNTDGTFCEQCASFYQDVPWQRADGNVSFECKACNCNNHSTECEFNQDIYAQTNGVSGGECLNCAHNTAGRQCEACARFYYPTPGRNQTDPETCTFCDCDLRGVTNDGDCFQEAGTDVEVGDCSCKNKTTGKTCDQCIIGYFNLSAANQEGCQECGCSGTGSLNSSCDQLTGVCTCKTNIVGEKCDQCIVGYYQADPLEGCVPCDCNPGGAFNNQCDMLTGQCNCRAGITGRMCSVSTSGTFFPTIDHLRLEGENAIGTPNYEILLSGSGQMFTGTGYYRVSDSLNVAEFGMIVPPASGEYEILFRYDLQGVAAWDSVTLSIRAGLEEGTGPVECSEVPVGNSNFTYTTWQMGTGVTISRIFCLRGGRSYTLTLQDFISETTDQFNFLIDSVVVVATDIPDSQVLSNPELSDQYEQCVDLYRSLQTQILAASTCEQVTFAVSSELYNGTLPCDCNTTGTELGTSCEPFGGQCSCLLGITNRQCDVCEPGTFGFSSNGCNLCECNADGSESEICDPVSGDCSCNPNVNSRNCTMCAPNHWGFLPDVGCRPCECNAVGSESLDCDQGSGVCTCKPGVIGNLCDQCEDLYYGFSESGCSACNCIEEGVTDDFCNLTSGQCRCKINTEGRDCSQCVQGTFNLQLSNPFGCQPCFCSDLTTSCSAASGYIQSDIRTEFNSDSSDPLGGWTISNTSMSFNTVVATTLSDGITIIANSSAYLIAPAQYLGYQLPSYGQFFSIVLNTTSVDTLSEYDLVLEGNGIEIGYSFAEQSLTTGAFEIFLHETSGWVRVASGETATVYDMQRVLSALTRLQLTASYSNNVMLYQISLGSATLSSSTPNVTWVEMCTCPTNYSGLSCEQCADGYVRNPSGGCELCQCSGFSTTCDPETGACSNCSGFTTGPSCSECIHGAYGDPNQDIPCQPCPCPLTSSNGQFSDECMLLNGTIVCLNCPVGHSGSQCEACIPGYFGDPLGTNGAPTPCSDCLCNGNIDINVNGSCDIVTGLCLLCLDNTAGDHCEVCSDGYYGDAVTAKNCTECDCNGLGSNSSGCVQSTGQCQCHDGVAGLKCDQCAPHHYGLSSGRGCEPCNCHPEGAMGQQCDSETGQCVCQSGVTGRACDQCAPGYFGLSAQGCQLCACLGVNSVFDSCSDSSGACICDLGATGAQCQECIQNYYQTSEGCADCPDCYQELGAAVNTTVTLIEAVARAVSELTTSVRPFEPALAMDQIAVESALESVQNLSTVYQSTSTQFDTTSMAIDQQLAIQLTQIDNSLTILKAASTTVFILASTTEELMNRTIEELLVAQNEVYKIASAILPDIERSVDSIASDFNDASTTAENLATNVALLTLQAQLLDNITTTVETLSSSEEQLAELTSTYDNNARNVSAIENSQAGAMEAIFSLTAELFTLTSAITLTTENILSIELGNLDDVPGDEVIHGLLTIASDTISYTETLMEMIEQHKDRLDTLIEELQGSKMAVSNLLLLTNYLDLNISSVSSKAIRANYTIQNALSSTEQAIQSAEFVLEELLSFSNHSFQVQSAAFVALMSVETINSRATQAVQEVEEIQERVERLKNDSITANSLAEQATTVLQHVERGSTNTTGNLAMDVASALNTSLQHSEDIQSRPSEASEVLTRLEEQESNISIVSESIDRGTNRTHASANTYQQAKSAVYRLCESLSTATAPNFALLNAVQDMLILTNNTLTADQIAGLHSELREALGKLQERRQELQSEIQFLQQEAYYLKQLNSTLPETCDSM